MIYKQLGRTFPTNTTQSLLYTTPNNGSNTRLTSVIVTKVINAAATFDIYINPGTTFDKTTAIFYQIEMKADKRVEIIEFNSGLGLGVKNNQVYVRSNTASAFNFNAFGEAIK